MNKYIPPRPKRSLNMRTNTLQIRCQIDGCRVEDLDTITVESVSFGEGDEGGSVDDLDEVGDVVVVEEVIVWDYCEGAEVEGSSVWGASITLWIHCPSARGLTGDRSLFLRRASEKAEAHEGVQGMSCSAWIDGWMDEDVWRWSCSSLTYFSDVPVCGQRMTGNVPVLF